MEKYWLIIDSYTFIWKNESYVLVYNSLSGNGYESPLSPLLNDVVEQLLDINNLYTVQISVKDLQDKELGNFVSLLREKFCGDIVQQAISVSKPISIVPQLSINEEVGRDFGSMDNFESFGNNVVRNLLEVTLYLNGKPTEKGVYKQIPWFLEGTEYLSENILKQIFEQMSKTRVSDFTIISHNIFQYPHFGLLTSFLSQHSLKVSFYTYYKSIVEEAIFHYLMKTGFV